MEAVAAPAEPAASAPKKAGKATFRRPNAHGVYVGREQCEAITYSSKHVRAEVLVLQAGAKSWAVGYDCAVGKWSHMCSGVSTTRAECRTRDEALVHGVAILLRNLGPVAAGARDGTYGVTDEVRRHCRYAVVSILGQVSEVVRRQAVDRVVEGASRG